VYDKARALVALPGWTWAEGMRSVWEQLPEHGGHRMTFGVLSATELHDNPFFQPHVGRWSCVGPDIDHPSNWGHLWAMLGPGWQARSYGDSVCVEQTTGGIRRTISIGANLGRALAAAIITRGWCGPNPPQPADAGKES
jgi:hypothetical protein